jgi:hypothetical protein
VDGAEGHHAASVATLDPGTDRAYGRRHAGSRNGYTQKVKSFEFRGFHFALHLTAGGCVPYKGRFRPFNCGENSKGASLESRDANENPADDSVNQLT